MSSFSKSFGGVLGGVLGFSTGVVASNLAFGPLSPFGGFDSIFAGGCFPRQYSGACGCSGSQFAGLNRRIPQQQAFAAGHQVGYQQAQLDMLAFMYGQRAWA